MAGAIKLRREGLAEGITTRKLQTTVPCPFYPCLCSWAVSCTYLLFAKYSEGLDVYFSLACTPAEFGGARNVAKPIQKENGCFFKVF
jgi:hypothetical protein